MSLRSELELARAKSVLEREGDLLTFTPEGGQPRQIYGFKKSSLAGRIYGPSTGNRSFAVWMVLVDADDGIVDVTLEKDTIETADGQQFAIIGTRDNLGVTQLIECEAFLESDMGEDFAAH